MKKEEFRQAVRAKLQNVPVETRKQWNDTDLLVWWMKAKSEDPYLTWERCRGDLWQQIPGICRNLIGSGIIW